MDISSLKIAIDSRDALTAKSNLDKLNASSKTAQNSIGGLTNSTALLSLKNIALGATMSYLFKEGIKLSDTWQGLNSRLSLATKNTKEFTKAQEELFKVAQNTRTSFEGTVELYARMARSTESLKIKQEDLLKVTEIINKTGLISGASAQQMDAGLMQLGQAFSAGALRGEELNSVLEQMPRLAKAIADGMKIEVGALKSVAEQGKITSKVLFDAISSQGDLVNKEFEGINKTVSQSMQQVENSVLVVVGKFSEASGAASSLSDVISSFSKSIDENSQDIINFGFVAGATIGRTVDIINLAYETLENTAQMLIGSLNFTVYGALDAIVKVALGATEALNMVGLTSDETLSKTKSLSLSINKSFEDSKNLMSGSMREINEAVEKASLTIGERVEISKSEYELAQKTIELRNKEKNILDSGLKKSKEQMDTDKKANDALKKQSEQDLKDKLRAERKLLEDWNKEKVELAKETLLSALSGYEQESLKLQIEHKDQLEKYSSFVGAKEIIDANYKAKKDALEKEKEFAGVQDSLNLYAQRVSLIENEYDREIELNNVRYANATTQLAYQLQKQEISDDYYKEAIANENLLFNKTIEDLEKIKDFEINISFNGFDDVSNGLADIGNSFVDLMDRQKELKEQMIKYPKDATKLILEYNTQQIGSYGDVAGAIAGMTKSGSKEYEILTKVQKTMYMTQMAMQLSALATQASTSLASIGLMTAETAVAGTAAIAKQAGAGDPYTAFARVAAMAGLLASFGIIVGGALSSSSNTTTSDAFSSMEANTGTGTVLGDFSEQSESLTKSMEILEDFAKPQYQTLQSMNSYLETIASNIGGVTSLLIQSGGFAFGEGYEGFDTGYKNNVSLNSGALGMVLNPINSIISKIPVVGQINKMFGDIMGSVIGGLFGKTSVSQSLTDSGIYFADTLLTEATDAILGSAYQTISTTTTKKSWFSKSSSTSIQTYFDDLDAETNRQFSLVLDSLYQTTLLAGTALDSSAEETAKSLENFVVSIGKISLKDKTGDEIQEELTAVFGKIGDDIAKASFPLLTSFQRVGEGMFETMTRVATGMEEAEYYIGRLGSAFEDIAYTDILNKSGDVGFEALLQSIIKTDEALYGLDNNLVNIIGSLDATAEELYGTYIALDTLRSTLSFLSLDIDAVSFSSIRGAGSLEALADGMSAYIENFLSDSEQLSYNTMLMQKEFSKLGLEMPTTKTAFTDLIESLDLSTDSGQELYGSLIILSEGFAEVADEAIKGVEAISNAFTNMTNSVSDTINKLIGGASESNQLAQIESYWTKRDEINLLLAKEGDLTATQGARLESLVSEVNSLALGIQSSGSGSTASLVSDLTKLENDLDFDNQILKVYIVGSDIEKETGVLTQINGSHASGLANVPFDGYIAELHKGERVMTAQENNNSNNRDSFLYDKIEQMNRYMKKMSDDLSSVIRGNAMQTRAL